MDDSKGAKAICLSIYVYVYATLTNKQYKVSNQQTSLDSLGHLTLV